MYCPYCNTINNFETIGEESIEIKNKKISCFCECIKSGCGEWFKVSGDVVNIKVEKDEE